MPWRPQSATANGQSMAVALFITYVLLASSHCFVQVQADRCTLLLKIILASSRTAISRNIQRNQGKSTLVQHLRKAVEMLAAMVNFLARQATPSVNLSWLCPSFAGEINWWMLALVPARLINNPSFEGAQTRSSEGPNSLCVPEIFRGHDDCTGTQNCLYVVPLFLVLKSYNAEITSKSAMFLGQ